MLGEHLLRVVINDHPVYDDSDLCLMHAGCYSTPEQLERLRLFLNKDGRRESKLLSALKTIKMEFSASKKEVCACYVCLCVCVVFMRVFGCCTYVYVYAHTSVWPVLL